MNPRLNKKVKKDLDAYFKGMKGSDPEVHHGVKHILIGALRDANFHSEAKKVLNMFPKANQSKYAGKKDMEDSIEMNHGEPIAKSAKWDGHAIIDAISYWVSMFIGGPVGAKVSSLKEGMNENFRSFVNQYIREVTHSYDYEDMSGKRENMSNEDENDKEEIKIGEYQTKYFHVCPGASSLYGDIESKGVDMDMAERSVRLQDALFFIEEHVGGEGYTPDKDYVMVAKNIAKNIMKMASMMGLEKEHSYIQGHVDTIIKSVEGKKLEERVIELTEKNTPTDPAKWAASKAAAKKKFDVYPSAYANAWAAKNYKGKGGGWRTTKESADESVNEAKSMDTSKRLKVYDKLKKGDKITIKYGSSMRGGVENEFVVSKGKTLVGKQKVERIILQNPANPKGVKYYLYQRNGNVTMAIGDMAATIEDMHESINEAKEPEVITQLRKIVKDSQNDLIKDTKSGKKVRVDMNSANLIVQVYDALKKQSNKDKFVKSGIAMMGHTAYKLMKKENITEYDVENEQDIREFVEFMESYKTDINEAEYQGRKVELGKISQGDVKKFKVYVKNDKGNVVKVNFGQKGMTIKKGNPGARKSFRARMNCDSPGPRWKARYWSCRKW